MPYSLARLRQTTRARERPTRPVSSCRKFSGGAKLEVDAIHCKRKTAAAMITPARMAGLAGVKGKNHLVLVVSREGHESGRVVGELNKKLFFTFTRF